MDPRLYPSTSDLRSAGNAPVGSLKAPGAAELSATAIYAAARSLQQRIRLALVNSRKPVP